MNTKQAQKKPAQAVKLERAKGCLPAIRLSNPTNNCTGRAARFATTLGVPTPPNFTKGLLMKFLNPTITINNMEGADWLVTVAHDFGSGEVMTFTVKVQRTHGPLAEIQKEAWAQADRLLQLVKHSLG